MTTEEFKELIKAIRAAVDNDEYELSEWEESFLESIQHNISLSPKQESCLERIHEKATEL